MREFKFRAWHEYGRLDTTPVQPGMVYDEHPGDCLHWKVQGQKIISITQWTGFTDSRGKDIYEGDILGYGNDPLDFAVVRWESTKGRWYVTCSNKNIQEWCLSDYFQWGSSVNVVGNIYENPDLLSIIEVK